MVCVPTQVLTSSLPISLLFVYIAPLRTLQACYPSLHPPLQPYPSTLLSAFRPFFFIFLYFTYVSFLPPSFSLPSASYVLSFPPCHFFPSSCLPASFVVFFPLSLISFSRPCLLLPLLLYFLPPNATFPIPAFRFLCYFLPSSGLLLPLLFPSSYHFFPSSRLYYVFPFFCVTYHLCLLHAPFSFFPISCLSLAYKFLICPPL
jgi:hypothetical protein